MYTFFRRGSALPVDHKQLAGANANFALTIRAAAAVVVRVADKASTNGRFLLYWLLCMARAITASSARKRTNYSHKHVKVTLPSTVIDLQ